MRARRAIPTVRTRRRWSWRCRPGRRRNRDSFAPELFEATVAAAVEAVELVAHRILFGVVLVVSLGEIERRGREDSRGDVPSLRLRDFLLRLLRELALRGIAIEDRRTVRISLVAE